MIVRPLTMKQANAFIHQHHRHHKPVHAHRFSLVASDKGRDVGVCVVARPVAQKTEQYRIAEVTRLATDGTKNACSFLYAAAARACDAMGFEKIQTFILETEPGTSLIAAGWVCEGRSAGGDWNGKTRGGRRTDQPQGPKTRWSKTLTNGRIPATPEGTMK